MNRSFVLQLYIHVHHTGQTLRRFLLRKHILNPHRASVVGNSPVATLSIPSDQLLPDTSEAEGQNLQMADTSETEGQNLQMAEIFL